MIEPPFIPFLRWLHPSECDAPWCLSAIGAEDGRIETRSFSAETAVECAAWVLKWNDARFKRGIYYSLARLLRPMEKKAERTDIREVAYLHVDLDPRKPETEEERARPAATHHDLERARILERLRAFSPKPTAIIDSGGGYQALWRLTEPIQIGGDLAKAIDAARYNRQLELELGGDHCHDVSRILRLPATINWPSKKKREKGRCDRAAELYDFDGELP